MAEAMRTEPAAVKLGGTALRPWILLFAVSLVSFAVNASAFTTLGVVLPLMVKEFGWSWTAAGLGYTILGAATGLSSFIPRLLIRRYSVRLTVMVGAITMAAGLLCLSEARALPLFYLGAALCGAGYQATSIIPATYIIGRVFRQPAFAIGLYFTLFALGSVFGPFVALGVLAVSGDDWHMVWRVHAVDMLVWGALCAAIIGSTARLAQDALNARNAEPARKERTKRRRIWRTSVDWTFGQAVRTPQFWLLAATYMSHMLVAISVSSLSIPHLTQRGVAVATAAAMLSLEQLIQTFARGLGGILGDYIDPLYILLIGLLCLVVGPVTLTFASSYPMMLVYAITTGLGYGLTVFSAVLLLLNYFGQAHNLEIFTAVASTGAVAALGPAIGGRLRDVTGNFQTGFLIFAGVNLLILIVALAMRPPRLRSSS